MIAWIGYTIVVTLLLSAAALAAERAARVRRLATRWTWALAIVASLLLPSVISSVSVQLPDVFAPAAARRWCWPTNRPTSTRATRNCSRSPCACWC